MIVFGAACDSVPDFSPELRGKPPQIEVFTINPQRVVYALLDHSSIKGDSVHIRLSLSVSVQVSGSPVAKVSYAILSPDTTGQPLRTGDLTPVRSRDYLGDIDLTLSALDVQAYPVLVYATDTNNRLGGEARSTLEFVRSFEPGSPPVIESVLIPERVQRPSAGEPARSLPFIVQVSDLDGLTDIALVEFWNNNSPADRILLCDDGNLRPCGVSPQSGDAEAGDGLFTRLNFIGSNNSLGFNTFIFEATDRAGLRSQQVSHMVEVYE